MDSKDNGQKVEWTWMAGVIGGDSILFETPTPLDKILSDCPERIIFRKYTRVTATQKQPGKLSVDFGKSLVIADPECQGFLARDAFMVLATANPALVKSAINYWGEVSPIIPATESDLKRIR